MSLPPAGGDEPPEQLSIIDAGPKAVPGAVPAVVVRVRMTVAYDGSGFHGFAAQSGDVRTVSGVLAEALGRQLGQPVTLTTAGRTDAGVHAWGQVVSFDAPVDRFDAEQLQRSLNRVLGPAVVVRAVEDAPEGFDARRSARARRYRYTVLNHPLPNPFLAATAWHVPEELDLGAMRLACDPLIGEHDFTSFCRQPRKAAGQVSMVRRVLDARWSEVGDDVLRFEIEASSFCQQMVRSIVGFMVAVGTGRRRAGEMAGVIRARDRSLAPNLAPAHGLCLWEVRYW